MSSCLSCLRVLSLVAVASAGVRTGSPQTLLLSSEHLTSVRARVNAGDTALAPAVSSLAREATKALALTPLSVMDKAITPPSGNKHDYMSQAPYWWPDPSKPDGRPYIRRDGERNPEINQISDHDNWSRLTNAISTLSLSFYMTGRPDHATHAARLVRVWFLDPATRMNPHLRFGQAIPGITDGRGIGIIESRVLPEITDGVRLLAGSTAWTETDEAGLQVWMRAYLIWLLESPHGKEESQNGNNHETWYDVQVASLALYTGQRDLARRTLEGSRARIARQIESDGRQPRELERTRSWHYSIFNLEAFFQLATLAEHVGVDLWGYTTADGRSLRRALDFLVPYAEGRQKWPYSQITTFDPGEMQELLRRAAVAWNAPRYHELAARVGGDHPRLALTVP